MSKDSGFFVEWMKNPENVLFFLSIKEMRAR